MNEGEGKMQSGRKGLIMERRREKKTQTKIEVSARFLGERHQQRVRHRGAEEEEDRVKVRSCEAERAAKSHTDCTYSKLGSESG